jgi:hypothetical protein
MMQNSSLMSADIFVDVVSIWQLVDTETVRTRTRKRFTGEHLERIATTEINYDYERLLNYELYQVSQ